ncbi:unnamed protein product [Absidia cylindrospora]
MISFAQTWSRITKQIKRKKSFQSQESSKSVRFYGVDAIYYTHSAYDYDRTPTEEMYDDDGLDDEDDDDDEDDQSIIDENILPPTPPSPTNSLLAQTSFIIPSTATSGSSAKCHGGNVTVVYDQTLNWEKVVPCLV